MAISIPSDLVMDVVNAADPVERQMAAQKLGTAPLQRLHYASAATGDGGNSATDAASFEKQYASLAEPAVLSDASISRYAKGIARTTNPVSEKFVALMLHEMLETMLPRDTEGIYGEGLSGDMWRSMLSEQLGNQMAKSDMLDLASYLGLPDQA
nr:rod-binding protein [Cohaesibacter haloalkalitolerans]